MNDGDSPWKEDAKSAIWEVVTFGFGKVVTKVVAPATKAAKEALEESAGLAADLAKEASEGMDPLDATLAVTSAAAGPVGGIVSALHDSAQAALTLKLEQDRRNARRDRTTLSGWVGPPDGGKPPDGPPNEPGHQQWDGHKRIWVWIPGPERGPPPPPPPGKKGWHVMRWGQWIWIDVPTLPDPPDPPPGKDGYHTWDPYNQMWDWHDLPSKSSAAPEQKSDSVIQPQGRISASNLDSSYEPRTTLDSAKPVLAKVWVIAIAAVAVAIVGLTTYYFTTSNEAPSVSDEPLGSGNEFQTLTPTGIKIGEPDYRISASPAQIRIEPGGDDAKVEVVLESINGFEGEVQLHFSYRPIGVEASVDGNDFHAISIKPNESVTTEFLLRADGSSNPSTYQTSIVASAGLTSKELPITVEVVADEGPPPNSSTSIQPSSSGGPGPEEEVTSSPNDEANQEEPEFSFVVNQEMIRLNADGPSETIIVTVESTNTFDGLIQMSVGDLPSGLHATIYGEDAFSTYVGPNSYVEVPLEIRADQSISPASYDIFIAAASEGITKEIPIVVEVIPPYYETFEGAEVVLSTSILPTNDVKLSWEVNYGDYDPDDANYIAIAVWSIGPPYGWKTLAVLDPSETDYVDEGLQPGKYEYVVYLVFHGGGTSISNTESLNVSEDQSEPSPQSVSISPSSPSLEVGSNLQLSALVHYDDGSSEDVTSQVSWSSENVSIAQVSGDGLLSGIAEGETVIHATYEGFGTSVEAAVTSEESEPSPGNGGSSEEPVLKSIMISPDNATIAVGQELEFTAAAYYSDGSEEDITYTGEWTSTDENVAIVNDGIVEGIAPGSTFICISYEGLTAEAALTVT